MTTCAFEIPAHTRGVRFTFVSDHVALDFAATVAWRTTRHTELLAEPEDFARWATAAEVVDRLEAVSQGDLVAARTLREAIYRLALAAAAGEPGDPQDAAVIRRAAAHTPVRPALQALGEVERRGGVNEVLATVAASASDLLGGPGRLLIRHCTGEPCTRLFLDRSRAGTRRWCSKRSCGSRINAAAYRRRVRQDGQTTK
ncbi:putative RNA-binding Zn ribbon-like protein [Streptomyces rishiriensis]|uniref:RNA-binding Zn ribbon-like protein n=1 Tax=Streptomyces rishiriensis TaxID=68264 RepID=A0ABU0NJ55_STRRH|nr:putative RNA-binding Zn ribbon-like protein [Streptomyces rishiriensis]